MRVANRSQPHSSKLTESAHHVKHNPGLPRLTEVQAVPHNNVEKIVRRQSSIKRRLNVITGNKELLPSVRRGEDRRFRIVCAVREKLERQKRMSGSAFSQVDLDGVGVPFPVLRAHYDKI